MLYLSTNDSNDLRDVDGEVDDHEDKENSESRARRSVNGSKAAAVAFSYVPFRPLAASAMPPYATPLAD